MVRYDLRNLGPERLILAAGKPGVLRYLFRVRFTRGSDTRPLYSTQLQMPSAREISVIRSFSDAQTNYSK